MYGLLLPLGLVLATMASHSFALPLIPTGAVSISVPLSTSSPNSLLSGINSTASANGTCLSASNPTKMWLETISHDGASSPFLGDSTYKVFRNVKDFGAVGDGNSDDSDAIQKAIDDGNRCAGDCGGGTTLKPALVYFPAGTYKVSKQINMYLDTQLVGDFNAMPTLQATSDFNGDYVIDGFAGDGSIGQSTTNFYLQVRNLKIDVTAVDAGTTVTCLNWATSQGTSLYNIEFHMSNNSEHLGVVENGGQGGGGSGTFMGDLTFYGGKIAFTLSNQQWAMRGFKFIGANTAISIGHVFTASFQDMSFEDCGTGIDAGNSGSAGSLVLLDSTATSVGRLLVIDDSTGADGSIVIDNVVTNNMDHIVVSNGNDLVSGSSGQTTIDTWMRGNVYNDKNGGNQHVQDNLSTKTQRAQALVDSTGKFFTKSRPQYQEYADTDFASVKNFGAKGDGIIDDTAAINAALVANAGCKITYFPAGTYIVTDTIKVPPGSRIVGEVWSSISASGDAFKDESNPKVVIQIGEEGDTGVVEVSDIIFTVADILPGAIIVEVNIADENQGDVGFWDVHFRIGGAAGSNVETSCSGSASDCKAAFMLLHLKPTGSMYLENVWGWTADHDLDGQNSQNIATGRGYLIETTKAAWFVGTASEHHTLYQYQLSEASNVFFLMIQVETPYHQPNPTASAAWSANTAYNDPDFSDCAEGDTQCNMAWGFRVVGGSNIYVYGSGFWVFFNDHSQDCSNDDGNCQTNIVGIEGEPTQMYLYNTNVKSVNNVIKSSGGDASRSDNKGGWGGVVAGYLTFSSGGDATAAADISAIANATIGV